MLTLSSSIISTFVAKSSAEASQAQYCTNTYSPTYGTGAALAAAIYAFANNGYSIVYFMASKDDLPSTRAQMYKVCIGSGDFGAGSWDGDALVNIYSQYSLTETNKAETNPRNFTKAFNQYFYGNDNEKTNAFVYQKLQELYGTEYKSFIYYVTSGTSRGLLTAYGEHGVLSNLYPMSTSPNSLGYTKLENVPGATIEDGFSFADTITPDPQYGLDTANKIAAAAIFGDYIENDLIFDVYVDGTKEPNVFVRWKNGVYDDTQMSLQYVNPIVWSKPYRNDQEMIFVNQGGIMVPDESINTMRKYANTWPGSYSKPWRNQFNDCVFDLNAATKILYYGLDGVASKMTYLLRFNYSALGNNEMVQQWGDCWMVHVPREVNSLADITAIQVDNTKKNAPFTTHLVLHLGQPEDEVPSDDDEYPDGTDSTGTDPGVYDPDVPPHDFSTDEATGYDGKAMLTKTYALTALRAQNLGTKLWTQGYFDVLKIQNNPIENIVSVKWFPFSLSGTDTEIKVGDIMMGTYGEVVDSIYKFTMGSVRYDAANKSNPSFLDMSPFTTLKLHLPYCGIIQLDATEMLNRKITVKYTVDLVSGDCMAFIYLDDNVPYLNVAGHCGVDVPLTSTNRVQAEMRAASTTLSAVTGAAAHMVSGDLAGAAMDAAQGALSIGGMDYTSQRTSSHSPACTSTGNRACYLEIFKPAFKESPGFKSRHGYPCHLFKQIGSFTGFIKCDARTKIDFAMTVRENEMLEQLLTSGVYV